MRAALAHGLRAATDVTGFGLLGHLGNLIAGSGVGARIEVGSVPVFQQAVRLAEAEVVPDGTLRNLSALDQVIFDEGVRRADRLLLADAQTSGGLLLATPPEAVAPLLAELTRIGAPAGAVIGEITSERGVIRVERGG